MSLVFLSLLLIFHVVFKRFQNVKNLILRIVKDKIAYLLPYGLFFYLKPCKGFRIEQFKQPRLRLFKTSGTALLDTIVSYKPSPSLFHENRKTLPQHL